MARQVVHMVWLKTKDEATDQQINDWITHAQDLKGIPGVVSVQAGRNFTKRTEHQVGLIIVFQDKSFMDGYLPHPVHKGFTEKYGNPIVAKSNAFDFEA